MLKDLDKLKKQLDQYRPLSSDVVKNLRENLIVNWTYNSNAIEGNTLTLKETKVILEDGITIGGKTLREHLEAINHKEAIEYIENSLKEPLSQNLIKNVHHIVLKGIDDKNAGIYRKVNVQISGAKHVPPEFIHIQEEMDKFESWYNTKASDIHPVLRSAMIHTEFVGIHPFIDGNGRTARLLMNMELLKSGYPAIVIPVADRLNYYNALDAAHVNKNYEPFLNLTEGWVKEGFNNYFFALGIQKNNEKKDPFSEDLSVQQNKKNRPDRDFDF